MSAISSSSNGATSALTPSSDTPSTSTQLPPQITPSVPTAEAAAGPSPPNSPPLVSNAPASPNIDFATHAVVGNGGVMHAYPSLSNGTTSVDGFFNVTFDIDNSQSAPSDDHRNDQNPVQRGLLPLNDYFLDPMGTLHILCWYLVSYLHEFRVAAYVYLWY